MKTFSMAVTGAVAYIASRFVNVSLLNLFRGKEKFPPSRNHREAAFGFFLMLTQK